MHISDPLLILLFTFQMCNPVVSEDLKHARNERDMLIYVFHKPYKMHCKPDNSELYPYVDVSNIPFGC